jgi:hypothetical protein
VNSFPESRSFRRYPRHLGQSRNGAALASASGKAAEGPVHRPARLAQVTAGGPPGTGVVGRISAAGRASGSSGMSAQSAR